jgi:signal transduction histidine kinase
MPNKSNEDELSFLSKKILDLNKQLIESEKAKSRFLSLVASELNNPITALLGILPNLKIIDNEQNRSHFDLIHSEALKLSFRIENLVMAAEIESGDIDLSYALLKPQEVIDDALDSLKYLITERGMSVNVEDNSTKQIITDAKKVYIIAKNLIANALMYSDENSLTEVETHTDDSNFYISVKNKGDGPHIKHKPEVFTRFANEMSGEHGLGIGLSIVRELCESLEGSIDYDVQNGFTTFVAKLSLNEHIIDSVALGSNEFLFDSFDDTIEI